MPLTPTTKHTETKGSQRRGWLTQETKREIKTHEIKRKEKQQQSVDHSIACMRLLAHNCTKANNLHTNENALIALYILRMANIHLNPAGIITQEKENRIYYINKMRSADCTMMRKHTYTHTHTHSKNRRESTLNDCELRAA